MAVKRTQHRNARASHKTTQQKPNDKRRVTRDVRINKKNKKAVVIAQEIKFARLLAGNDKRVRDKVLKNLKKWLTVRSKSSFAFTETDFMRLWKGLFYCMWMSDKPLVQEELAESLSKIVHCFDTKDLVMLYTTCALRTLATEWLGIDQYRLDKFAMLSRRIIRQTFQVCKVRSWDIEWVIGIAQIFEELFVNPKTCLGLSMHVTEIFMEEFAKISSGDVQEEVITELVRPFTAHLAVLDDERQIRHIMKHVFRYLIFQSEIGLDYMEKFHAWRQAGFPTGNIDAMEKVELSDDEDKEAREEGEEGVEDDAVSTEEEPSLSHVQSNLEKPLDPRAGTVHVDLPQIPFNAKKMVDLLAEYKADRTVSTKSRRQIVRLIEEFTELAEGRMPLGIKQIRLPNTRKGFTNSKAAATRLLQFDKDLYFDTPHNMRKRKRDSRVIDEDSSSEINTEIAFNDSDAAEAVENEGAQKKKKVHHKTNGSNTLPDSKCEEPSAIEKEDEKHPIPKKKKKNSKLGTKIQTNRETNIQSNTVVRKVKTVPSATNNKRRKPDVRQIETSPTNNTDIVTPVKRKKGGKAKGRGCWDVSPSSDSPILSSTINEATKSGAKSNNGSVMNTPIGKGNNSFDENTTWLLPVLTKLEHEQMKTPNNLKQQAKSSPGSSSKKRVKIVLQRNTAQHTSEYMQQLRQSPAIPFDANKKPLVGVLKSSPLRSPINPFYKKNSR